MMKYQGTVGFVNQAYKFGGYSFTLRGIDGFFKYPGEARPKFKVGGYLEFEADDKKVVDIATLKSSFREDSAPAELPSPKVIVDPRIAIEKDRQHSIHFQSAHKDAIEVAQFLASSDMVKLPAAQAKKYDAFLALIDELTNRFFAQFEQSSTDLPKTEEVKKEVEEAQEDLG